VRCAARLTGRRNPHIWLAGKNRGFFRLYAGVVGGQKGRSGLADVLRKLEPRHRLSIHEGSLSSKGACILAYQRHREPVDGWFVDAVLSIKVQFIASRVIVPRTCIDSATTIDSYVSGTFSGE
jgi:hypothetical protein